MSETPFRFRIYKGKKIYAVYMNFTDGRKNKRQRVIAWNVTLKEAEKYLRNHKNKEGKYFYSYEKEIY